MCVCVCPGLRLLRLCCEGGTVGKATSFVFLVSPTGSPKQRGRGSAVLENPHLALQRGPCHWSSFSVSTLMSFDAEKEEQKKWKDLKMIKKLERQREQEEQAKRQQEEEEAAAAKQEDQGEPGLGRSGWLVRVLTCPTSVGFKVQRRMP